MGSPTARPYAIALAAAAAWAAAVPYLGRAVGARVDVPAHVEVIDHVLPALVVLAAAALLAVRRPDVGATAWSVAAGATFLAGAWIVMTHAPLLGEALSAVTPWRAALLHLGAGLPVLLIGLVLLLLPLARAR